MEQTITDEEIEKIIGKVPAYAYNEYTKIIIEETVNLISSRKNAEWRKFHEDEMHKQLNQYEIKIMGKDAEIEKLDKMLKDRNWIIERKDIEIKELTQVILKED